MPDPETAATLLCSAADSLGAQLAGIDDRARFLLFPLVGEAGPAVDALGGRLRQAAEKVFPDGFAGRVTDLAAERVRSVYGNGRHTYVNVSEIHFSLCWPPWR